MNWRAIEKALGLLFLVFLCLCLLSIQRHVTRKSHSVGPVGMSNELHDYVRQHGVVPRTLEQVFGHSPVYSSDDWHYTSLVDSGTRYGIASVAEDGNRSLGRSDLVGIVRAGRDVTKTHGLMVVVVEGERVR